MKFLRKKEKGFTIVELVIVIAVIAVLAAVLIPTFISLTNKANKASDEALVKNLNTALAAQEQMPGDLKNNTMHDAVEDLKDYGYLLPNLATKSDEKLLWDRTSNRFLLEEEADDSNALNYWRIQDNLDEQKYNVYAGTKFAKNDEHLNQLKVGFDAGYTEGIESLQYVGGESAQEVLVRTNGGTLVINAPADKVHHFGVANIVDIQAVASSSYYEKGTVTFAKIKTGRLVVTEKAEIGGVHAVATTSNTDKYFDNIKIALVGNAKTPELSRDAISVDEKTEAGSYSQYILEVQTLANETTVDDAPEYVWANISIVGSEKTATTAVSKVEMTEEAKSSKEVKTSATPASEGTSKASEAIAEKTQETKTEQEAENAASEIVAPTLDDKYVARINMVGYETLDAAIAAAQTLDTVHVLKDIENYAGGSINKSMTLNLNGFTITGAETPAVSNCRVFTVTGNYHVEIKNGTIDATGAPNLNTAGKVVGTNAAAGTGFYGAIRAESYADLVLKDLTVRNYRPWGMNIKITSGSNCLLENVSVISSYGGGVEAGGGSVTIRNCHFTQSNFFDWNSSCVAASNIDNYPNGGVLVIENSEISTDAEGNYAVYVFSSGGQITVNGGSFSGTAAAFIIQHGYSSYHAEYNSVSEVTVNGGTFNGGLIINSTDTEHNKFYVNGGTFTFDPSTYVDLDQYKVVDNQDGTWTVSAKA